MHRISRYGIGLLLSVVLLVSCGRNDEMKDTSDKETHAFVSSDQETSDELMETIIEGINNKDLDSVKNIFSVNTINSDENLDEEIQGLFDFMSGDIVSYEESDPSSSFDSFDKNYKIRMISSFYYVSTEKEKYFFLINNYSMNTKDTDMQGVKYLIVVKADDRLKVFDKNEKILFDENGKIERTGIFIPNIY